MIGVTQPKFLFDQVMVPVGRASGDKFTQESCDKQLSSDYHCEQSKEKQRPFGHFKGLMKEFFIRKVAGNDESGQKNKASPESEKMHGPFAKAGSKRNGNQVKISFVKAIESVFGLPELSFLMVYHLLPYL